MSLVLPELLLEPLPVSWKSPSDSYQGQRKQRHLLSANSSNTKCSPICRSGLEGNSYTDQPQTCPGDWDGALPCPARRAQCHCHCPASSQTQRAFPAAQQQLFQRCSVWTDSSLKGTELEGCAQPSTETYRPCQGQMPFFKGGARAVRAAFTAQPRPRSSPTICWCCQSKSSHCHGNHIPCPGHANNTGEKMSPHSSLQMQGGGGGGKPQTLQGLQTEKSSPEQLREPGKLQL